jgi:predicted nucleic acid-binding protein
VADLEPSAERPKLYLDTSVISYLAARPSRDALTRSRQELTRYWREHRRHEFALYTSELVKEEAERGNAEASRARMEILRHTQLAPPSAAADFLAPLFLRATGLPKKASNDMRHVALATVHGMKYLLTWNCKHLANPNVLRMVTKICQQGGYQPPLLCTPEELLEV